MSINVVMADKTTSQVPTWDEFEALQRRIATLEQQQTTLRNAVIDRNNRGPAADEVMTGRGVGLAVTTGVPVPTAPAAVGTDAAPQTAGRQVAASGGPAQSANTAPPPPRAPLA